jgi:hypothetical protein
VIVPGPFWQRHRHFLVADGLFDASWQFVVLDESTGRRYVWNLWPPGSTTIGVPTTWTFLHRGWTDHVFSLVEEPDRLHRISGRSTGGDAGISRRLLNWLRSRVL